MSSFRYRLLSDPNSRKSHNAEKWKRIRDTPVYKSKLKRQAGCADQAGGVKALSLLSLVRRCTWIEPVLVAQVNFTEWNQRRPDPATHLPRVTKRQRPKGCCS